MLTGQDIINMNAQPEVIANIINGKAFIDVKSGVASASTITLSNKPSVVLAVLAVVKATGAVASKFLIAPTTDYTISGQVLTCVTDQSANTLIIIYK